MSVGSVGEAADGGDGLVSPDAAAADIGGTTPATTAETEPETTSALEAAALDVPAEETPAEEPAPAGPTGVSPKVQKIVDTKYGGDWEKFADSIYEQQNSAARLHEQLQELRELIAAKPEEEPQVEAPPHPDIQWLEQQIQALDTEAATTEQRRNQILLDINKRDREIAAIDGEMKRADDFEKQSLMHQKLRAESALERLMERFEALGDRQKQIDYRKREFQYQRKYVDSRIEAERANQKRADFALKARESEWQNDFLGAFEKEAEKYTMTQDQMDYMFDVITGQAGTYLSSLPKNAPAIDLAEYARKQIDRHVKATGIKAKVEFANQTRQKLETRTQVAPKGSTVPQAPKQPGEPKPAVPANKQITAAAARAHAARILGG